MAQKSIQKSFLGYVREWYSGKAPINYTSRPMLLIYVSIWVLGWYLAGIAAGIIGAVITAFR